MTYLGKHGSPESLLRYEQLLEERQRDAETKPEAASLTISVLSVMYIGHCRHFYRKNGKVTSGVGCVQQALRPLVALYGKSLAAKF